MHKQTFSTKAMVEAGLISTMMVAVFLLTVNLPMFSGLSLFILPIPVAVLCLRHNYSVAAGAVFVSAVLSGMLYSPVSAFTSSAVYGLTGLTLGYCIKTGKEVWTAIAMLAASAAAAIIIDMAVVIAFVYNSGFTEFVNQNLQIIKDSMQQYYEYYRQAGASESQLQQLQQSMGILTEDYVIQMLPISLAGAAFGFALLCYSAARAIMRRLKYDIKPIPPVSEIYINNRAGTFILVFAVIGAVMSKYGIEGGRNMAGASLLLAQMVFTIDGVALAAYYLRRKLNMGRLLAFLVILLTVSSAGFIMVYVLLGLSDMIFDFRKLDPFRRKIAH
ncbi:MAG: hypothetical protein H6Q58_1271 [Firmicutes bacterium]|nr:hypothetical protein [Bacillota bacterium]